MGRLRHYVHVYMTSFSVLDHVELCGDLSTAKMYAEAIRRKRPPPLALRIFDERGRRVLSHLTENGRFVVRPVGPPDTDAECALGKKCVGCPIWCRDCAMECDRPDCMECAEE